ncbi:predicted protein [Botrytis cinerea T4]|uniref:Uncharacterized protein n=1 Tax=Botryotinia fuckeliana (strain T4) TaxID=999810 RepID=G2Y8F6_BOTF4|nr:predicted protein [Botrytis cinerea T4]
MAFDGLALKKRFINFHITTTYRDTVALFGSNVYKYRTRRETPE